MRTNILIIISLLTIKGFCQKDTTLFKNKELIIYKKRAYFKGKELYNAERDLKQFIKQEETDECKVSYEFYYNPLSLVGNYYSYESGNRGEAACGPPGNTLSVHTIDLNKNRAVSLSDLFTEESILRALKEDVWIKDTEKRWKRAGWEKIFQKINSFEAFVDSINIGGDGVKFKSNGFAVLGYDRKNGKVAIRFVGQGYMGYNHNKHFQLGLWIEPKQSYKQLFKNRIHFMIGDYKSGLKK